MQTESAEKATVLTGEQTVDLPLVDRGFMGLLAVVPGAVGANRYSANVNGARNDELSVKLDGMSNMDSGVNMCCSTWVNPDTIAEFRVVTNAATAEFGHAGGPDDQRRDQRRQQTVPRFGLWIPAQRKPGLQHFH